MVTDKDVWIVFTEDMGTQIRLRLDRVVYFREVANSHTDIRFDTGEAVRVRYPFSRLERMLFEIEGEEDSDE